MSSLLIDDFRELKSFGIYDESQVPDLSNYSILIVEDEKSCYLYLYAALKRTNAKLHWVKDGQSAVDYIDQNNNVDLVLMDIKLPIMTGYRATEIIKAKNPNVAVIAQTAYAMAGDREKCMEIGCDDYLPKPFSTTSLYNAIGEQLNRIAV